MGTIARGAKSGGGTSFNPGQSIVSAEVDADFDTIVNEMNGLLDDGNIQTATLPGAKSLRFTEIAAPATPAAEDLVLYAFDQSGTTSLMAKDSAGGVMDLSSRLGAAVYHSATESVPNNTLISLTFDSEEWDVGDWHSVVSEPSRLTVPLTGKYLVLGQARFQADTDLTRCLLHILHTGVVNAQTDLAVPFVTGSTVSLQVASIALANPGDWFSLSVYQQNTSTNANAVTGILAVYYLGA
jgi:hypothetical protein